VINASPATVAPPDNAAAPMFPAKAPIFSIGILAPNPSVSFIFVFFELFLMRMRHLKIYIYYVLGLVLVAFLV
jgi:hypothetical protein